MKINIRVKPSSSQSRVVQISEKEYQVYVKAKPIKGEANKKVREVLCQFLNLPKHKVVLIAGKTSRHKIFEINK